MSYAQYPLEGAPLCNSAFRNPWISSPSVSASPSPSPLPDANTARDALIVAVVAPEILLPLARFVVPRRHWNVGAGLPDAVTIKLAGPPAQTVALPGWAVICGA